MCQVTERQTVLSLMMWISKEGKQGWEDKKAKCVWAAGLACRNAMEKSPKAGKAEGNNGGNNAGKAALSSGK